MIAFHTKCCESGSNIMYVCVCVYLLFWAFCKKLSEIDILKWVECFMPVRVYRAGMGFGPVQFELYVLSRSIAQFKFHLFFLLYFFPPIFCPHTNLFIHLHTFHSFFKEKNIKNTNKLESWKNNKCRIIFFCDFWFIWILEGTKTYDRFESSIVGVYFYWNT